MRTAVSRHTPHRPSQFRGLAILACCLCLMATNAAIGAEDPNAKPQPAASTKKLFADTIQPLLKKRCLGCHGEGDELSGGLDLRSRESLLKGGETGPALILNRPEDSLLYQSVLRTGDVVMPPQERNKLTSQEIQALKQWIAAGAPWGTADGSAEDYTAETYRDEDLWAYRPVRKFPVPQTHTAGTDMAEWEKTPVDAFILRSLQNAGLTPAPPADRLTLIRRATFDLIGLPPTPEEIADFLNDRSPDAFSKVVERLLASPHYGEQWGRHWLDVVRYADTAGFSNDYERPHAWRYRDYVIRSFNQDKPYDRFILEQLAGDEIAPDDPEALIATGFLRMGPWEHTGMSVAAVTRQMFLDDVTNIVGETFLAHGLQCAKCHDHKFDPVPTHDYYSIQAVFAPVQFEDRPVPFLDVEPLADSNDGRAHIERMLAQTRVDLRAITRKHQEAVAQLLKERGVNDVKDLPESERPRRQFGLSFNELGVQKVLRKRIAHFELALKRYDAKAFAVSSGGLDKPTPPDDVYILVGGALESPGDKVSPGVLTAVAHYARDEATRNAISPGTSESLIPQTVAGRRAALARWIADADNPLTARVMVNRIWQSHFGTGLCANANNFGKMGGKPTHPELLDWLAVRFIEDGWSVKALHRLIMNSAVYQTSGRHPQADAVATVDPNNKLLAWFPPRRLTAEELRDAMLAVSGELSTPLGGRGVFPEINREVALQPRHIMGSVAPAYLPSATPEERNRRTVYAVKIRTLRDPLLEVFNQPGTDNSCESREATTVTPQAFTLLNSQTAHDRALALACRLESEAATTADRIARAYRLLYGREPSNDETSVCLEHWSRMVEHHRQTPPVKVDLPQAVERSMAEEMTGEAFTWTEDVRVPGYIPDKKPWDVGPETRALAELCLVLLNANEFVYVY
jgi:hypothetical protein